MRGTHGFFKVWILLSPNRPMSCRVPGTQQRAPAQLPPATAQRNCSASLPQRPLSSLRTELLR
jgi:hypothetical protein